MKNSETAVKDNQSLRALLGHRRVGALKLVRFEHMQGVESALPMSSPLSESLSIRPDRRPDRHGKAPPRERLWEVSP